MEEIELRDALRHHVTANEPPMGLNASDLLSTGRRRRRWRVGLSIGSGGAAAAIAITGAIAVLPGGGADPWLGRACSIPIAATYVPRPSTYPDQPRSSNPPTPYPTWDLGSPSPDPSARPTSANPPTPYPTRDLGSPSPDSSAQPTPETTIYPTPDGTYYPIPDVSSYPSGMAMPTASVHDVTPSYPPDQPRMQEMECHLKNELKRLIPGVKLAKGSAGEPLRVYTGSDLRWNGRDQDLVYIATAIVIGQAETIQLTFRVEKPWEAPTGPEHGWSFDRRGDLIVTAFRTEEGMTMTKVYTPDSTVFAYATGTLLSAEQLIEISSAIQMDMFR